MSTALLRCTLAAFLTTTAAQCAFAQEPSTIIRWDFQAGAQGWFAGHSVAPLEARDGLLVVNCTGEDPWIEEAPGELSFEGAEQQYIVMRARVAEPGPAEFFWEVDRHGFKAGQEVGFHMAAGDFRTYTVFPVWKGRITRLRFDPPAGRGQKVLVDWIAIMSLPPSQAPEQPVWDFSKGLQGWIPQANVSDFAQEDGALRVTGFGPQGPTLLSPRFSIAAEEARFLSLSIRKQAARRIIVYFSTEQKPEFDARRFIIIPFYSRFIVSPTSPPTAERRAVDTSKVPGWEGRITRLRLEVEGLGGPPAVWLESVSVGRTPTGPAAVRVNLVRAPRVMYEEEDSPFWVEVQNVGGSSLSQVAVGFDGFDRVPPPRVVSLAPGETVQFSERLTAGKAGPRVIRCFADARGAARAAAGEIPVSRLPHDAAWVTISRRPHPQPPRPQGPKAMKVGENIWLANQRVAACFVRNPEGYGPIFLFRRLPGHWRPVGVLLRPTASLKTPTPGSLALWNAAMRNTGKSASVTLSSQKPEEGALGQVTLAFRLGSDEAIEVDSAFTCNRDDALSFFRAVTLLAGEKTFGEDFREALFPGLEYMETGEQSSSTLDASPPHDLRYAPHPHRITIPLMAVSSREGDVVALMWQMPPNARKAGPAAAFRSPHFMDNHRGHRMELFLPAIPEWTSENRLVPDKGMPVRRGQTLRVRACIYIGSSGEVLDAVRARFRRYGLPSLPKLARSYKQEIAFCLRSYEQVLRVPGKGWYPGILPWARFTERSAQKALHYLLSEQVLGKDAPFPAVRVKGVAAARGNVDVNLAVHAGGLAEALLALRSHAYQVMASQGPDGGWGFEPSAQTEILGTRGEKEIGFAGNRVALMLNAGRMLQDPRLIEAGRRGLKFMDQFRIPRAAQVWEVPVHTPDVLASAHAVDAYLAGYLATGQKEYLRKAVYWAETGIPFHYFWQADEKGVEAMMGGGIPVFGATFFTWPWFGRIVQWCSLDYAASLLRLAPYDNTYPWRRIAEAITRSAMIQQRREPKYYGLYPDSIGMVDKEISWGAMLGPTHICHNVLALMGKRPIADVKTVRVGGGAATIIYGGDASIVKSDDGRLELSLRYPPGYASYLGVTGVAPGAVVRADGRVLPAGDLSRLSEGTRYHEELALLVVKIRHGQRPVRLSISGLKPGKPPGARTAWDFEGSTQGWAAWNDMAPLRVKQGRLVATIAGGDPFMGVGGLNAEASQYRRVRIVMRSAQSGQAQLFFAADGRPISEEQSKHFQVAAADDFVEYVVDMRGVRGWTGIITELRLDPVGPPGSSVEIEEIELLP